MYEACANAMLVASQRRKRTNTTMFQIPVARLQLDLTKLLPNRAAQNFELPTNCEGEALRRLTNELAKHESTTHIETGKKPRQRPNRNQGQGTPNEEELADQRPFRLWVPLIRDPEPPLAIPDGVPLAGQTQRKLYQLIRASKMKNIPPRKRTETILNRIKKECEELELVFTKEKYWKGIRNRDMKRTSREFLWKTTHDIHAVGDYWNSD